MLKGIDVSRHNGTPDFATAKANGISFVYVKATEGKTYTDPMFQPNMYNAMKAGLPVGCYHFARPDNGNSPQDEANNFVNAISVFNYDLLPVLDLEVNVSMSNDALYNWAKTFIDTVKAKTGHNVMLYTGLYYLNTHSTLKNLAGYGVPLWIAAYRSTPPTVDGWNWAIWQYTDNENIPGVGTCDANYAQSLDSFRINNVSNDVAIPSNPVFKRVLKLTNPRMRGDDVKILQKRLNVTPVDGIFGPATEQAVKNWQKVHDENGNVVPPYKGLTVDGIVGQKTWNALFNPKPNNQPANNKPNPSNNPVVKQPTMYRMICDGQILDTADINNIIKFVTDAVKKGFNHFEMFPRQ